MTFRQYILAMGLGTVIAWAAFLLIVALVDPLSAGTLGLIFFYVALAVATSGTLALIGLFVRTVVVRTQDVLSKQVTHSFREGFLVALLLVAALVLQSRGMLSVLNTTLLLAVLVLTEFFFLSYRPRG
ncbi:hypothetical protein EPO33_01465 [Patescibacteria group bacterium]|nr:MAG: hypothetical protein EPO33_01465 [Patescibacteria group bacterium]